LTLRIESPGRIFIPVKTQRNDSLLITVILIGIPSGTLCGGGRQNEKPREGFGFSLKENTGLNA